jgi:hypothetical protein
MRPMPILFLALLAACAPARQAPAPTATPAAGQRSCADIGGSDLEGVCIEFGMAPPTWTLAEAAAGVSVPYTLIVEADVPDVLPQAQDAGNCDLPGPSGLTLFERLSDGAGLQYCLCDSGLCDPEGQPPETIEADRYEHSFRWGGREWFGESDFGNPMGGPFPPGEYTLTVSAVGTAAGRPFRVAQELDVTLVP